MPFNYFSIDVISSNTHLKTLNLKHINKWELMQSKWRSKTQQKHVNENRNGYCNGSDETFRTPTRKKNIIICFSFIGKIESIVYKSDENRAKMRPDGTVSKNRWDVPKIPFSKLWCMHVAAFNVPCAKTMGPNMIAITVGFMTSELHVCSGCKWEEDRERERESRKNYGFNASRVSIRDTLKNSTFLHIF